MAFTAHVRYQYPHLWFEWMHLNCTSIKENPNDQLSVFDVSKPTLHFTDHFYVTKMLFDALNIYIASFKALCSYSLNYRRPHTFLFWGCGLYNMPKWIMLSFLKICLRFCFCTPWKSKNSSMKLNNVSSQWIKEKISEFDQEIPQSHTADQSTAPWGWAA